MVRWLWVSCVVGAVVFLSGCNSPPKPVQVSGTVTVDGKPLNEGDVTLVNTAGLPPDIFPVKGGKFEGLAKPGKVKVEIRAYRPAPPPTTPVPQESKPTPVNYLPEQYNNATTLTAEVTATGLNPSQFSCNSR